jgi:hypothetical protein
MQHAIHFGRQPTKNLKQFYIYKNDQSFNFINKTIGTTNSSAACYLNENNIRGEMELQS